MSCGEDFGLLVLTSILGFTLFLLLDVPQVYTRPRVSGALTLLAILMLAVAFYTALNVGPPFPLPQAWRFVGWVVMGVGVFFTLFVVFVEIPWRLQCAGGEEALVTTGTYAACRHPGFWGVALFCLGAVLAFPRTGMVALGVLWLVLEGMVVWVQDRWLFPRRFPAYRAYQRQTPFLLPSRRSLQAMWLTWPCQTVALRDRVDRHGG